MTTQEMNTMTPAQYEYLEYSGKIQRTQQRISVEQNPEYVTVMLKQLRSLESHHEYLASYLKRTNQHH